MRDYGYNTTPHFISWVVCAVSIMVVSGFKAPGVIPAITVSEVLSGTVNTDGKQIVLGSMLHKRNIVIAVLPLSQTGSINAIATFANSCDIATTAIFLINAEEFISQSECRKILREQSIETKLALVSGISSNQSPLRGLNTKQPQILVIDRAGKMHEFLLDQVTDPADIFLKVNKVLSLKKVLHTVSPGETLSSIANKYFSSSDRWTDIYKANRDRIKDPTVIFPGQILIIPLE